MRIALTVGRNPLELDLDEGRLVAALAGPVALANPGVALSAALEAPAGYPALRRALTPGDRVALVLDEELANLELLLIPLLDHISSAGVQPDSITVVCPTSRLEQTWIDQLPDAYEDVQIETHDSKDRRRSSYLATTSGGRRLYLNRSVVDADQVVVLSGRRYDLALGHGGAEGVFFPALADAEAQAETAHSFSFDVPGEEPWPLRREAIEVSWLLGQPFFVQVIASAGDGVAAVVAGASDASLEGQRLLDHYWKKEVDRRSEVVVATVSGDPSRHTFADLAAAVSTAARVVQPGGRVILLSGARPALGPGSDVLRANDDPRQALSALEKTYTAGSAPAMQWAVAACHARLSVYSPLPEETIEELYSTPLAGIEQVQKLLRNADSYVVLEDAHRMMCMVN
jgi:nickel-dependent lactate racemase